MLEAIVNTLQIGDEAPNYLMRIKRVEESGLDPYEWNGVPNGAMSLEISSSRESGAATANVRVANASGLMSPEVLQSKTGKLVLKPAQISIKPGEEAQFYAYVVTEYNNVLVGGPGVLYPEQCDWKIVPIGSIEDYGDVSGFQINNGKVTNTTISNGSHYAECKITATYKGSTVTGSLLVYDKSYMIDVPNPIFMIRDSEEQDGDWFYFTLNGSPLVFSNQGDVSNHGYGIVGEDSNLVLSGVEVKSAPELDPIVYGFRPPGFDYNQFEKVWTEIPLYLKPGINKLKITSTWNGKRFYDSGKDTWNLGNVTGNAQLCYPDAVRTPKYTEDGSNGTLQMESIYVLPKKIDLVSGELNPNESQAGPQAGLYDLMHGVENPRQTVTWLIEYRNSNVTNPDNDPLTDVIIDDPNKYFNFFDDEMLTDYTESHYKNLFIPENYCQLCLGYGDVVIPVITGAIDTINIDSKSSVLSFTMRDNIRYLVDQTINALKWGKQLSYPKTNITVKGVIDPSKTVNRTKYVTVEGPDAISVRTGPSVTENMIGQLSPGDRCTYLGTTNGWHCIMYGSASGFVDGSRTSVHNSGNEFVGEVPIGPSQTMVKIQDSVEVEPVYSQPELRSNQIGLVRKNETYAYLRTVANGTFFNVDYNGMSGYIRSEISTQTTENMDGYANDAKYQAIQLPNLYYLKTAPSETAPNTTIRVYNGDTLDILGIEGDWRKVKYPFGDPTPGYIHKDNVKLVYIPRLVNTDDNRKVEWKATDMIMDLAIEATTIKCFETHPLLDRSICNVIVEDYYVPIDGELAAYTIPSKSFPMTESYFDACMEIVNLLGHVSLRCTRYGDIALRKDHRQTQLDNPDWLITDYVDLTSLTYKKDAVDTRNRVIIQSTNGWNMYEHPLITEKITKGVNRTTSINIGTFGDTEAKRRLAASNFFEQILSRHQTLSIAIKGNPLIEINQICEIRDLITGTNSKFSVREIKHTFSEEGFITQLELDYIATLSPEDLIMLTDQFPSSRDTFNYRQYMTPYENKKLQFKYGFKIASAKIRVTKNGSNLAEIEITRDVTAHTETTTVSKKYVYLESNQVNVRMTPNGEIKKIENYGYFGEYLGTEGSWYKLKDYDGQTVYVWSKFGVIRDGGTTITNSSSTDGEYVSGSKVQIFLDALISKIGCAYVWGAEGPDSFDCSGFICWGLIKAGVKPYGFRTTAEGLWNMCSEISSLEARPGDLIFRRDSDGTMGHVVAYLGNGVDVEAMGSDYGVTKAGPPIRSSLTYYGRFPGLSGSAVYTHTSTVTLPEGSTTISNDIPDHYSIKTTYLPENATQAERNKASENNGNVLCAVDGCVLYNVGISSDGSDNNVITLSWASSNGSPTTLDLTYDIIVS
jgi:cell wall-associated NlpC family hydrolase